eukprot:CAMPEP_0197459226 /NCGR_PEP_ID=MMETSP1175-20131217/50829_1 /TAXON_ID=1003142 /ORGANISM="Triceratium dubium, Strain CCMP147" /LENGTH=131 /DNA_ID=CAMNT_0042994041 /DNA_START=47 /DNA_END=438 /DNA_ORIENTATION=+
MTSDNGTVEGLGQGRRAMEHSKLLEEEDATAITHLRDDDEEEHHDDDATLWEVLLFLSCGMGASLCYTATLSSLVYFKAEYGPASFVYLNLAVFFPLLPVSVAQAKWDHEHDIQYGSGATFLFRGVVGFAV